MIMFRKVSIIKELNIEQRTKRGKWQILTLMSLKKIKIEVNCCIESTTDFIVLY
jgi:hypothetical protein